MKSSTDKEMNGHLVSLKGFTFLEIIITFSIVGVLLIFTMTVWHPHQDNPLTIRKKELISMLTYARLQAFLHEETLILEPIHLMQNHEWGDGARLSVLSTPKRVLHEWQWTHPRYQLYWFGFQSKDYLQINADPTKLAMNGHFVLKNQYQKQVAQLVVNRFGRIK